MDSTNHNFAETASFFRWKPSAWLRVTGEDALTFLQGQFTNDLRALREKAAVYGLWLNHKGRVLADSFVLGGGPGEYWIGSYYCAAETIRERLEAFVIADDVVIEDETAQWSGITVFDSAQTVDFDPSIPCRSFAGRRTTAPHREFVFKEEHRPLVDSKVAGLPERSADVVELLRIENGMPRVPADIGPSELPNEAGLDEIAISYTKGCYLGQEVMARLKSMGQVRRRLLRVRGTGSLPALPAAIFAGDRRIGELRTAAAVGQGFVGLALLSLINLKQDTVLSFGPEASATVELSAVL